MSHLVGRRISEVRRYPDSGRAVILFTDGTSYSIPCDDVAYHGALVGGTVIMLDTVDGTTTLETTSGQAVFR